MGALDGKVAVVAGASRGLGKGIAIELAAAGAVVYAAGRSLDRPIGANALSSLADTVADAAALGGVVVPVRCDALDEADVAALFDRVAKDHGRLDVLVKTVFNSNDFRASIGQKFWEMPMSSWHDIVDLGTRTAYTASVFAAPLLLAAGAGGAIVNVSGRGAEIYRYNVAYGVGKAALDKMTRDMAVDFRDVGVAVVSLWPNVTRTEQIAAAATGDAVDPWAELGGIDALESPRYSGRAVVAMVSDRDLMRRTGGRFWSAQLGAEYGLVDEFGRSHVAPTLPTS
jgi:NAD(P)-dependent dehydrogenase (short-subunit alcohol dehydrogenase family)